MKLLLVEDDERIALALAEDLSDKHYVVDVARDGEAGWELVEVFTYGLLLLDVTLPRLSGISLCERLRSCNYRMPILLLGDRAIECASCSCLAVAAHPSTEARIFVGHAYLHSYICTLTKKTSMQSNADCV